jgi:hypothetical protein
MRLVRHITLVMRAAHSSPVNTAVSLEPRRFGMWSRPASSLKQKNCEARSSTNAQPLCMSRLRLQSSHDRNRMSNAITTWLECKARKPCHLSDYLFAHNLAFDIVRGMRPMHVSSRDSAPIFGVLGGWPPIRTEPHFWRLLPDRRSSDRNLETQKTIRPGSIRTGDGRGSVQPRVILRCSVLTGLFACESRLRVPLDIQVDTMFT